MRTWIWPFKPKSYCGPSRYDLNSISRIPTGSLYFASRNGPMSRICEQIHNTPYDIIGIIFQSNTRGKEGTYVYMLDPVLTGTDDNAVVTIRLIDLIQDKDILEHGVIPLNDLLANNPDRHRTERNNILKELFKEYSDVKYDVTQSLAVCMGVPENEGYRDGVWLTQTELVSRILYRAGLMWDDDFSTDDCNPASNLFYSVDDYPDNSQNPLIITLETPYIPERVDNSQDGLRRYLEEAYMKGEKGYNCKYGENHVNYYYPKDEDVSPRQIEAYTNTIQFGSLSIADLLIDVAIPKSDRYGCEYGSIRSLIERFNQTAVQRTYRPRLNMSWYHNTIIPIESFSNTEGSADRIDMECSVIQRLLDGVGMEPEEKIPETKSMDVETLRELCDLIGKISDRLHRTAVECGATLTLPNRQMPVEYYQDGMPEKIRYKVADRCINRYPDDCTIIMRRYMWDRDWTYTCDNPTDDYHNEIDDIVGDLVDCSEVIPMNCRLLELTSGLIDQAKSLK